MSTPAFHWSDEELGFLVDNDGWTLADLAEALGRTKDAVRRKRSMLRKGWEPTGKAEGWTREEDEFVLATPNLTAAQVAVKMSRSTYAVRWRRKALAHRMGVTFGDYATRNKDPHRIGCRSLVAKTCVKCGLLLDASWFTSGAGGSRSSWATDCKRCVGTYPSRQGDPKAKTQDRRDRQSSLSNAFRVRMAAITEPLAENRNQPWVSSEDRVLADADLSLLEKALKLGRTYAGVSARCSALGYTSRNDRLLGDPSDAQWYVYAPNAEGALWEAS